MQSRSWNSARRRVRSSKLARVVPCIPWAQSNSHSLVARGTQGEHGSHIAVSQLPGPQASRPHQPEDSPANYANRRESFRNSAIAAKNPMLPTARIRGGAKRRSSEFRIRSSFDVSCISWAIPDVGVTAPRVECTSPLPRAPAYLRAPGLASPHRDSRDGVRRSRNHRATTS
jgi:hypothetical protein